MSWWPFSLFSFKRKYEYQPEYQSDYQPDYQPEYQSDYHEYKTYTIQPPETMWTTTSTTTRSKPFYYCSRPARRWKR